MCHYINRRIISGLKKLLDVNLKDYSPRYLSYIYNGFKRLSLCSPMPQERKILRKLKDELLGIIQQVLVKNGMLQVAERERHSRSGDSRVKRLFRGFPDELPDDYKKIYEDAIEKLKRFFDGKYITSN